MAGGELFLREIREQPAALRALLAGSEDVVRVGREIAERSGLVRLVAHGSSDNAASYAVYAFGLLAGRTAMRDSISLSVYYDADVPLAESVVIALSQSGRTPDVVSYVERARERGALTVALTNEEGSPLSQAAERTIAVRAGPERAVAATKTYTNELAALALLAASAAGREGEIAPAIAAVAERMEERLPSLEREAGDLGRVFTFADRMLVIGRGVEYATARELALKLAETCRVASEALTATDLVHGPVAALDPQFPVWAIAAADAALPAVEAAVSRAREVGAHVVASGTAAERLPADDVLAAPPAPVPVLSPLLSVLPGQLFAGALARAKGLDPDAPGPLTKVTLVP